MLEKQVYDLTKNDINQHSAWYFPMDDSVEDELTVRPFNSGELSGDFQIIVRTVFADSKGKEYVGYIYWSDPDTIENIKPVLFVDNDNCITFWNGIIKPSWLDYGSVQQKIKKRLPLTYKSDVIANLHALSGTLEGLYYIDDNGNIRYEK